MTWMLCSEEAHLVAGAWVYYVRTASMTPCCTATRVDCEFPFERHNIDQASCLIGSWEWVALRNVVKVADLGGFYFTQVNM